MESESKPITNCKSRRSVYVFALFLIFLLDWAALHDILKGQENTLGEYSMLVISLFIIRLILLKIFKKV